MGRGFEISRLREGEGEGFVLTCRRAPLVPEGDDYTDLHQ